MNRTDRVGRDPETLYRAARTGHRAATGRLLSLIERGGQNARNVGRLTFGPGADADHVVGITGAPGAGKSTLTDRMIVEARRERDRVGVIAVDPSSPFSGGAILGDRIRMQGHVLDEGVFVRSMATRGHLGGLALAVPEAVRVLVATGYPLVLVETVGVGQVEVDISRSADTTVVVVNPGWGDAIQASKAGLLEVADVFVVNKADRRGADESRRDLENMLDMNTSMGDWRPPIVLTQATEGQGVELLWSEIRRHRSYLLESGQFQERRDDRLVEEMNRVLAAQIEHDVKSVKNGDAYEDVKDALLRRELDPYDAASALRAGQAQVTHPISTGTTRSG